MPVRSQQQGRAQQHGREARVVDDDPGRTSRNARLAKSRGATRGSGWRRMWATNATAIARPVASTGQVRDAGHPGASVSAVHTSPTAPRTRTVPTPSMPKPVRCGSRQPPRSSPRRGKVALPAAKAATMTGRLMTKIQRQLDSTSSPPSTGPLPAATAPMPAHTPTAVPRCRAGNTDIASPSEVGMSTAAPTAGAPGRRSAPAGPGIARIPATRRRTRRAQPGSTPGARGGRRPVPRAAAVPPARWRTHRGSTRHPTASPGQSRAAAPGARC